MVKEIVSVPEPQAPRTGPRLTERGCETLFHSAHKAGMEAGNAAVPTPMCVVEHANAFDDNSPVVRAYAPIAEGVCGFAWISVRPGNSAFARWLKRSGNGRTDSYYGGVSVWVSQFGQSYERKRAYARAFAEVLTAEGVKAYASGRLD
jgi:hypothetical protein